MTAYNKYDPAPIADAQAANGHALIKYDTACRAIAEAYRIDEVKDIHDKAVALQEYARRAKNTTMIVQATKIRMLAERRAGELLIQMAKRGERASSTDTLARGRKLQPRETVPKLADLGINKTQSSRWQGLAALPAETFEERVARASANAYDRLTGRFLKEAEIERARERHRKTVEHGCTVDNLIALAESGYRAGLIYPDPPWPWQAWSALKNQVPYVTSTIEAIKALPVERLAADDCVLLIWAMWAFMPDVLEVIRAWGFTFKTLGFDWVKTDAKGKLLEAGLGPWTRCNPEPCLLATRGSPTRLASEHAVVLAPIGEHSEKPEEVRRRIERLLPGPYLELYGRKPVDGWTVWGNEIRRDQFNIPAPSPGPQRGADSVPDDLDIPAFLRRTPTTEAAE